MKVKGLFHKIAFVLPAVLLLGALMTGCGAKEAGKEVKNVSIKEIRDKIGQAVDITQMKEADAQKLKKLFDMDAESAGVEEFIFLMAPTNIRADELLILKMKDMKNKDQLLEKIKTRNKSQADMFRSYKPEETYLCEKNILSTKGSFIFYAVAKDNEKMSEAFSQLVK